MRPVLLLVLALAPLALPACKKSLPTKALGNGAGAPSPGASCAASPLFGPLERQPVLQGRYSLCVPVGTVTEPNPRPLMGAVSPTDMVHRLRLPTQPGSAPDALLLFQDTLALADAGWTKVALQQLEDQLPGRPFLTRLGSGVDAMIGGPDTLRPGPAAGTGATLRHPDGTLQFAGFVLDEGASSITRKAVVDLLRTLEDGGGARPIGGSRQLPTGPADEVLRIDLPAGFVVTTDRGPDFVVHRMTQLVGMSDVPASGAVYFGGHPSFRPSPQASEDRGAALGHAVVWKVAPEIDGVSAEALITLTGPLQLDLPAGQDLTMHVPRDGWFAHVMVSGPSRTATEPLMQALENAAWGQAEDERVE